jgi:cold shock CspA family protein
MPLDKELLDYVTEQSQPKQPAPHVTLAGEAELKHERVHTEPVQNGTVRKFLPDRKFGFIGPDDDGPDVFFHTSGLRQFSDVHRLRVGAKVDYVITLHDEKTRAKDVKVLD